MCGWLLPEPPSWGQRSCRNIIIIVVVVVVLVAYSASIPENITAGTVILRPSCIDRDLGTNGQISYIIAAGNDEVFERLGCTFLFICF